MLACALALESEVPTTLPVSLFTIWYLLPDFCTWYGTSRPSVPEVEPLLCITDLAGDRRLDTRHLASVGCSWNSPQVRERSYRSAIRYGSRSRRRGRLPLNRPR